MDWQTEFLAYAVINTTLTLRINVDGVIELQGDTYIPRLNNELFLIFQEDGPIHMREPQETTLCAACRREESHV